MQRVYVGLDLGSSSFHVVAMDEKGTILRNQKYETSRENLIRSVEGLAGEVWVHLESSGLARWVREVLRPRVGRVVVSHAKTNAWITKDPLKRDSVDAWKLADLLRMGRLHEVFYSDEPDLGTFKELVQHYDDVTQQQAKIKVKIKARLKAQGVLERGDSLYKAADRPRVLALVKAAAMREAIEQLYTFLDDAMKTQEEALKLMKREAKRYPEIGRFRKVPGVGFISAAQFFGYVQTPHRFRNKRKLWRYCQLGITDRSSDGKPLGRQRLDRNGNGRLKHMSRTAFMGALKRRDENRFKRSYQASVMATHNETHARLSAQRKIVATLWAMWKGGTSYQDSMG